MLRNNITIEELQFCRNNISDDGARAIAAVLAEQSAIKFVDLRQNNIGMLGIKAIAEALERSDRVQKVFVHPGGKIEAVGTNKDTFDSNRSALNVSTVCVVDVRENQIKDTQQKTKAVKTCTVLSGDNKMSKSEKRRNTSKSPCTKQSQNKKLILISHLSSSDDS